MRNYPGNKNFSNVIHFLMNRLPKSKRYFSLFFGGGGLEQSIYTADAFFICAEKNPDCKGNVNPSMATIAYSCYKELLKDNVFTQNDFLFADPPYIFSTRRSERQYYKNEFTEEDHIEFLNLIKDIPAKILITHPVNDLYNEYLSDWSKEEFTYMTRQGTFTDAVYYNYSRSHIELLNYDCLGTDFTDRQRIKRQRKNMIEKFKRLDPHIRRAISRDLVNHQLL